MKKLLLSLSLAVAACAPAVADDYVFYIGTEAENNAVTNYTEIKEGANYEVLPELHDIQLHCAAYIKVANNTAQAAECAVDIATDYDRNEFGDNMVMWQTCLGTVCQAGNVSVNVAANSETPGGTGEHIGYSMICFDPAMAEAVKFDSKYNVTMTMGSLVRHFTITYTSEASAVDMIGVEAGEAEYFNMQGVRVANPEKGGMYIVRQGGKVSKTILR